MGKKNRQKKNQSRSENQPKLSKLAPIIMVTLGVVVLTSVYFLTKPKTMKFVQFLYLEMF